MTIESFYTLTQARKLSLKALLRACANHDKTIANTQWLSTQQTGIPSVFLYQKNERLIGALKLFFFEDNTVEIALIVAPEHRRQGIATQLFEHAIEILKQKKIRHLTFCSSKKNNPWLDNIGATLYNTEFVLQHNLQDLPECPSTPTLASVNHTQDLIELDVLCFEERSLTPEKIQSLLLQKNYQLWIIIVENKAIAKLHLKFSKDIAVIYDVGVHPEHQRKGYGEMLLSKALHCSLQSNKEYVELEVESENKAALSLYIKYGFSCQRTHHYWQLLLG